MTTTILFVQGAGAGVHDQWDHKLVESLTRELGDGYSISYPYMPNEAEPSYAAWKPALIDQFDRLEDGAFLVGHSVGGTILVNLLAETVPAFRPAGLILIAAPFVGAGGWPSGDITPRSDLGGGLPPGMPVHLFHGMADETVPVAHAKLYADAIPLGVVHLLPDRDHQLNNDLGEVAELIRSLSRE